MNIANQRKTCRQIRLCHLCVCDCGSYSFALWQSGSPCAQLSQLELCLAAKRDKIFSLMRSRWGGNSHLHPLSARRDEAVSDLLELQTPPLPLALLLSSRICDGRECHLSTSPMLSEQLELFKRLIRTDTFSAGFSGRKSIFIFDRRRRSCSTTRRDQSPVDVFEQDFAPPHQFLIDLFIYSWISLACLHSTHEYLKWAPGPWCIASTVSWLSLIVTAANASRLFAAQLAKNFCP